MLVIRQISVLASTFEKDSLNEPFNSLLYVKHDSETIFLVFLAISWNSLRYSATDLVVATTFRQFVDSSINKNCTANDIKLCIALNLGENLWSVAFEGRWLHVCRFVISNSCLDRPQDLE